MKQNCLLFKTVAGPLDFYKLLFLLCLSISDVNPTPTFIVGPKIKANTETKVSIPFLFR